ncbi:MAG: hypothetical protein ACRDL7_06985, partial [Gaiellaceae bacterium]
RTMWSRRRLKTKVALEESLRSSSRDVAITAEPLDTRELNVPTKEKVLSVFIARSLVIFPPTVPRRAARREEATRRLL